MGQLVQPNELDAAAVDARQEIDLRVGASFTRFQTMLLQARGPWGWDGVGASDAGQPLGGLMAGWGSSQASPFPPCVRPPPPPLPRLQEKFDWLAGGVEKDKPLLSYGPCQFPTLGLIVQRAWCGRQAAPVASRWGLSGAAALVTPLPRAHQPCHHPLPPCRPCLLTPREIQSHVSEPFWYIHAALRLPPPQVRRRAPT
jgi:hypothetical protein